MATDLCSSEAPPATSPRISFSHNLSQSDINQQRLLSRPASASSDFDFCIRQSNVDEPSSAADLFSDGVILPTHPNTKHETPLPPPLPLPPVPSRQPNVNHSHTVKRDQDSNGTVRVESRAVKRDQDSNGTVRVESHAVKRDQDSNGTVRVESRAVKGDQDSNGTVVSVLSESRDQKQKSAKSSFWQFKRSSSLNCGNGYARTLCPIPLLSRSHSTGSASSSNKSSSSSKEFQQNLKQNAQKKNSVPLVPIKQSNSPRHQKIPSKKSGYAGNGNGSFHSNGNSVRVNPVLNVSAGNLFGLGSIFTGNKEKNKKK